MYKRHKHYKKKKFTFTLEYSLKGLHFSSKSLLCPIFMFIMVADHSKLPDSSFCLKESDNFKIILSSISLSMPLYSTISSYCFDPTVIITVKALWRLHRLLALPVITTV